VGFSRSTADFPPFGGDLALDVLGHNAAPERTGNP